MESSDEAPTKPLPVANGKEEKNSSGHCSATPETAAANETKELAVTDLPTEDKGSVIETPSASTEGGAGVVTESNATEDDSHLTPSESVARAEARIKAARNADFIKDHGRLMRDISDRAFDPFRRYDTPEPPNPKTRMFIAFILVPIRVAIAFLVCLTSYMIAVTFGPRVTKRDLHTYATAKLPRWRRAMCEVATRIMGRGLLLALGFWFVHGSDAEGYSEEEARKNPGATIISNHVGIGDPCLLCYLFTPAMVAKMALAKVPFVGRVGSAQHSLYINRFDGGVRKTTDAITDRQKLAATPGSNIPPVCIFPEGTTTNGTHLLRFKTGAFVAGLPVAPVLLKYPYKYFSPSFEAIKSDVYIKGLVQQPWNEVYYHRLPLYFPNAEEREDPKLYADNVRLYMEKYSDFLDGKKLKLSDSNFVTKREYIAVLRGERLPRGVDLTTAT